jgi:hypothetical protein
MKKKRTHKITTAILFVMSVYCSKMADKRSAILLNLAEPVSSEVTALWATPVVFMLNQKKHRANLFTNLK